MHKNAIAAVKKQLEKDIESGNPNWNISPETAKYLVTILEQYKPMRVLEIGTSTGYSALCMGEVLASWHGVLLTIESHEKRFATAKKNIADATLSNITQIKGHAPEILNNIEGTFDLCFFDATKYEHLSYFNALKKRLNPNGIIITDNMRSHEEALAEYKKMVEADPQFESELVNVGTGLLVSTYIG